MGSGIIWRPVATGTELFGYLDGEEHPVENSFSGGRPLTLASPYRLFPDQPIRMGMSQGLGGSAVDNPDALDRKAFLDGLVDDAIIFSRALSQSEVRALMTSDLTTAVEPKGKLAVSWASLRGM